VLMQAISENHSIMKLTLKSEDLEGYSRNVYDQTLELLNNSTIVSLELNNTHKELEHINNLNSVITRIIGNF
jgi:hypothetical protein